MLPISVEAIAYAPSMAKAEMILDVDPSSQLVTIWCKPFEFTSSMLGHELMHLRRNVLESTPKLMSATQSLLRLRIQSYNSHLFIFPEKINKFPDA